MPIERVCKECGKQYLTVPSQRLLFCGDACYHKSKRGSGNPKWRGGTHVSRGYIYQYAPDHPAATKQGYVRQHRLVMESALGRLLTPTEVVHHKNGVKNDNRLENLELCASTGKHSAEHHVIRDRYGRMLSTKPYRNPRAKLTDAQIAEIRAARAVGETLVSIARRFGMSVSGIHHHTMSGSPNFPR